MKQLEKALRRPITGILISIVMGFIVGAIVLSIAGYNPAAAYASMISRHFFQTQVYCPGDHPGHTAHLHRTEHLLRLQDRYVQYRR